MRRAAEFRHPYSSHTRCFRTRRKCKTEETLNTMQAISQQAAQPDGSDVAVVLIGWGCADTRHNFLETVLN